MEEIINKSIREMMKYESIREVVCESIRCKSISTDDIWDGRSEYIHSDTFRSEQEIMGANHYWVYQQKSNYQLGGVMIWGIAEVRGGLCQDF